MAVLVCAADEVRDGVQCRHESLTRSRRGSRGCLYVFRGVRICVIVLVVSLVVGMSRGVCGADFREDEDMRAEDVDDDEGSGDVDTSRVFTPLTESFSLYHSSAEVCIYSPWSVFESRS